MMSSLSSNLMKTTKAFSVDLDISKDRHLLRASLNIDHLVVLDAIELANHVPEATLLLDSESKMAERFGHEELDAFLVVNDRVVEPVFVVYGPREQMVVDLAWRLAEDLLIIRMLSQGEQRVLGVSQGREVGHSSTIDISIRSK